MAEREQGRTADLEQDRGTLDHVEKTARGRDGPKDAAEWDEVMRLVATGQPADARKYYEKISKELADEELRKEMADAIGRFEGDALEVDQNISSTLEGIARLGPRMTDLEIKIRKSLARGREVLDP